MRDEDLRDHERGAARGDPAAEQRWIAARLRAGELDAARLPLAAFLGSAGARLHLGEAAPPSPLGDQPDEDGDYAVLFQAVAQLGPFGREACARAALGIAQAALATSEASAGDLGLLGGIRAWIACPCPRHAAPIHALRREHDTTHVAELTARVVADRDPARVAAMVMKATRRAVPVRVLHRVVKRDLLDWALGRVSVRGDA